MKNAALYSMFKRVYLHMLRMELCPHKIGAVEGVYRGEAGQGNKAAPATADSLYRVGSLQAMIYEHGNRERFGVQLLLPLRVAVIYRDQEDIT